MDATLREFCNWSGQDGQAPRYRSAILLFARQSSRARNSPFVAIANEICCKSQQWSLCSLSILSFGYCAMAKRKAGTIYKTKDGRYRVAVWLKNPDGTKAKRVYRTCRSQAQADIVRRELLEGNYALPDSVSIVDDVLDAWMHYAQTSLKPKTVSNYRHLRVKHISPRVGCVTIQRFTPLRAQQWVQQMISEDVGDVTIQRAKSLLQRAFMHACDMEIVNHNPLLKVTVPAPERNDQDPFTQDEVIRICECSQYGLLYKLAFQSGMRQGELFGLRRRFVDIGALQLRVAAQVVEVGGKVIPDVPPKTKKGRRVIPISHEIAEAIAQLDLEPDDFVFTAPTSNKPIRYSNFRERVWARKLRDLGIRHRGMHQTRHTAATHMLRNGIEPHVVSRMLGHSRPSITLDIYAHVIPEDRDRVRSVMSAMEKKQ